uniref:Uncharacterized protein n=1 Tax=Candidatus Kentrum sp. TC TaxID=2126339 RepID=A0A450YUP0_9GAMM|nr:MAG: hypothetical protein BECKTC1821E_GA0114239_10453 [Candidatus Kentron sp. TC]
MPTPKTEEKRRIIPPSIFRAIDADAFGIDTKDDREKYDLEDVNVEIARGIAEAMAHQRGEIELPDARDALETLMDGSE